MSQYFRVGQIPIRDDERSWMMGVNVATSGEHFPRVSRRDYHILLGNEDIETRNDDVLLAILAKAFKPGSEDWKDYLSTRAGRRDQLPDGTGRYTVGRIAPPRSVPVWEYRVKAMVEAKSPGVKQYSLAMVLADAYVRAKYEVPMSLVASVKEIALTCPADAAATMQEYMQSRSPNMEVKVVVGAYADGLSGSRSTLATAARKYKQQQVYTAAALIGDKFHIYAKDDLEDVEWCVMGPVKFADTVRDVYNIAKVIGKHETIHLFATETARLRIDISIDGEVVAPDILGHGRDMTDMRYQQDSGVVDSLSAFQRVKFEELKGNVLAVRDAGVHCSTAVQLQRDVALVNKHVVDESVELTLHDKLVGSRIPVGDDLWAVRSSGDCKPWSIRPAVPGEFASIMYYNGSQVAMSAVFKVKSSDGCWLLSELVEGVYPGMSGGAVVAMSDMSLLGVHCGEMRSQLKAAVVSDTLLADSYDFVTETSDTRYAGQITSDAMTHLMVTRGLGTVVASVVDSMCVVEHCNGGLVASGLMVSSDQLVSVCGSGDKQVLFQDGSRRVVTFDTSTNGMTQIARVGGSAEYKVRTPQLNETAVLIAMDAAGPVVTGQLKVSHVGPQGRNMQLEGFSDGENVTVRGACAVSLQDGAVLGIVVRAVGSLVFCLRPPVPQESLEVATEVAKVFPRLSVAAWDLPKLTGVFRVGSDIHLRLAKYGESALRYRLLRAFSNNPKLEESQWDDLVRKNMSDDILSGVCFRFGLHRFADVGEDVVRDLSLAETVSLVLAFVGMVDTHENDDSVQLWLEGVGLVGDIVGSRPAVERRTSGFNVLSDMGDVLLPVDGIGSPVFSDGW